MHGESLAPAPKEEELVKLPEITIDHELTPEELYGIAEDYGYPRASEWEYLTGFYDESTEMMWSYRVTSEETPPLQISFKTK